MRLADLRALMDRDGVSSAARAVWWAIASHANGDGDAWPATEVIARMAGMSTRSVSTHLRALEAAGVLSTTRLPTHQRNRYHIPAPEESFGCTGRNLPEAPEMGNALTSKNGPLKYTKKEVYKGASDSTRQTTGGDATPHGVAASPQTGTCTSCRAPIVFARLPTGRIVALDARPDHTGLYALLDHNRTVLLTVEQHSTVTPDVQTRLRRAHNDICDQYATVADTVTNRRVNHYREHVRETKLNRERNR